MAGTLSPVAGRKLPRRVESVAVEKRWGPLAAERDLSPGLDPAPSTLSEDLKVGFGNECRRRTGEVGKGGRNIAKHERQ